MWVEIIKGTYGRKVGAAVKPLMRGEAADLPDKEAARLISIGVARLAAREGEREARDAGVSESGETACVEMEKELERMSFQELKTVAKEMGVEGISGFRSKEQLIMAIREFLEEIDPFELKAEDPE